MSFPTWPTSPFSKTLNTTLLIIPKQVTVSHSPTSNLLAPSLSVHNMENPLSLVVTDHTEPRSRFTLHLSCLCCFGAESTDREPVGPSVLRQRQSDCWDATFMMHYFKKKLDAVPICRKKNPFHIFKFINVSCPTLA